MQATGYIQKVHPYAKAVPEDQGIVSLGTYIEIFKGEALIIKEEGSTKANDKGTHSYLWDRWVMDGYPLVLLKKVKIYIERLRVLYLRWWKSKVICGMSKYLEDKYEVFDRKKEGETL